MNAARASASPSPADVWHSLLRPEVELSLPFWEEIMGRMRAARLTFGDRVHCPFLRPFFLSEQDDQRVRCVAETIAALGERVVAAALESPALLEQLALGDEELRLARIEPGYKMASTASRLDSFLLPESLEFAEYNAESPAGLGYAETLGRLFSALPLMTSFQERFHTRMYPSMALLLEALLASYREWGGQSSPPVIAIVDWREVPTWTEFEIIQAHFEKLGMPTIVCDPRDLVFDGRALSASGRRIDLVYRRVLMNDVIARPTECEALVRACVAGAVCMANTFRCKIAHKKAFFAVLTDDRNAGLFDSAERELIARHVPWTRLVADVETTRNGEPIELLEHIRRRRDDFVLKPNDEYGGTGVTLGWETSASDWDAAIEGALADPSRAWVAQQRIAVRREQFPQHDPGVGVTMREMLVDSAPYLFRGRLAGFLTRLSSTGLANVTSGGGQVPAFVVSPRA
jgi:uncharacterized circularly permuted ATP-grasp superfamily protein